MWYVTGELTLGKKKFLFCRRNCHLQNGVLKYIWWIEFKFITLWISSSQRKKTIKLDVYQITTWFNFPKTRRIAELHLSAGCAWITKFHARSPAAPGCYSWRVDYQDRVSGLVCSYWCSLYLINLVTTNQSVSLARIPYFSTQVRREYFFMGLHCW